MKRSHTVVFKSLDNEDRLVDLDTQYSVEVVFKDMPEVKETFMRIFNTCDEEDVKLFRKAISN